MYGNSKDVCKSNAFGNVCPETLNENIDGLVQEIRNSIANALELRLSCTNPST